MFTRDDAKSLRETLRPLSFSDSSPDSDVIRRYLSHYKLKEHLPQHKHSIGTVNSGKYKLVCQYFAVHSEQQKGCIFLVHGYYDHLGLYGRLIAHCLNQGYSVFGFDLPGHGLSTGDEASIDSFAEYTDALLACLDQLQNLIQEPWIVIGQSTGGAIIMDLLLSGKASPFESHIMFCPLLYTKSWRWSRLMFYLVRWFLPAIQRKFTENSHDREFLNFIRHEDFLQSRKLPVPWVSAMIEYHRQFKAAEKNETPVHIIQGTGDTTVDWLRNLPLITDKFPQSTMYKIDDARHHLVNESEEYRAVAFEKVSEILSKER